MLSGLKRGLISPGSLSAPIYRRSPASGLRSGMASSGDLMPRKQIDMETGDADPFFPDVALLLHFNGANNSTTFTDVKGKTIGSSGSPIISTTQSKHGGSSLYLDGSSALSISRNDVDLRSSVNPIWTIECWLYQLTQIGRKIIFANYNLPGGAQSNTLFIGTNQIITDTTSNFSFPQNQWVYFAATRNIVGVISIYIDGMLAASSSGNPSASANTNYIGGSPGDNNVGGEFFNGYVDDFRVTYNVRTDFTPPTAQFPDN